MGKRNRLISLNKAVFLTQGNPITLGKSALFFCSGLIQICGCFGAGRGKKPVFQPDLAPGWRTFSAFSFITPDETSSDESIATLIDFLCYQAGDMGALNVLTDIEETHPLFEQFRKAGFCAYGWESIWRIPRGLPCDVSKSCWGIPSPADENVVRTLYQTLIPPLVQNAEPFVVSGTPRLVYKAEGELVAYAESISGTGGIYLVPVIHPAVKEIRALLLDLVCQFQEVGRPVYMQVRSYQAWLAEHLQQLGAEPAPRFSLLVKHLAVSQLNAIKEAQRVRSDQRQAEPTAPVFNHCVNTEPHSDGLK